MMRRYEVLFYPMNGVGRLPSNSKTFEIDALSIKEALSLCYERHPNADVFRVGEAS